MLALVPARVFVLASITDAAANLAVNVVRDIKLPGVFLLMTLESACIPIPSEATMLFAGFNASRGVYSLLAITVVGSLANLLGSWIAYALGYYGRLELLERHGRKLHIRTADLARADRWFERYGGRAVFFSRMLPVVRTFISLPAGVARMPFWRFSALTLAGCVPWVFALGLIGQEVGSRWESWRRDLHYVDLAVAAMIVVGLALLAMRWWRGRREPVADAAS